MTVEHFFLINLILGFVAIIIAYFFMKKEKCYIVGDFAKVSVCCFIPVFNIIILLFFLYVIIINNDFWNRKL